MITYKKATTTYELIQILELQKENLPLIISSEEKEAEGFLTVQHDFDILNQMNDACPHIIAKDGEKLVGYTLCMHPKFEGEIELLKPMFKEIKNTIKPFKTYMVMGQVCINKAYRRQGVFRNLYAKMQELTKPEFDSIVTEVDINNQRSLQAHYAIGFKALSQYKANDKTWELIYLE